MYRTERSPILWQAFLEVARRTERSPIVWEAFVEVAHVTERSPNFPIYPASSFGSRVWDGALADFSASFLGGRV